MYECCPPAVTEIESAHALVEHADREGSLDGVVAQGLDLRDAESDAALRSVPAEDACFLGCRLTEAAEEHVRATGGTLFPAFTGLPFRPYRASLYSPDELMNGFEPGRPETLSETVDHRIYRYFVERQGDGDVPVMDALAFRIHDHAIDDALRDLLHPGDGPEPRVVGVMGGHGLGRDTATYRTVARVGWRLAREGFTVATGGGPGAMEAANLGACLAAFESDALASALDTLAEAPHYDDAAYFDRAHAVRPGPGERTASVAIPTWFYGHEPSNLFATHIAKYFANSIREDGLLAIATCGVVFAPGSAGTIQEVFMDAAQNHYESVGPASPMIFLGAEYWTDVKPVYPLVETLSRGTPYGDLLALTDAVDDVVAAVRRAAQARAVGAEAGS